MRRNHLGQLFQLQEKYDVADEKTCDKSRERLPRTLPRLKDRLSLKRKKKYIYFWTSNIFLSNLQSENIERAYFSGSVSVSLSLCATFNKNALTVPTGRRERWPRIIERALHNASPASHFHPSVGHIVSARTDAI